MRSEFLFLMSEKRKMTTSSRTLNEWLRISNERLQYFNENLYRAFKEQFVRFVDLLDQITN